MQFQVIHNELDYRLPITEGLSMFNVLQSRNVPSRLLSFPDENHVSVPASSLSRTGVIIIFRLLPSNMLAVGLETRELSRVAQGGARLDQQTLTAWAGKGGSAGRGKCAGPDLTTYAAWGIICAVYFD